jgi:putative peptidoglycan lipid II flippase
VGSFLLWFFMPQLLLYAAGAVASALLQADRRFTAAAVAPVFNNVVVTATMVAFAFVHDPKGSLSITVGEKVLLGAGTLAGTVALVAVPFVAACRVGLGFTPRWSTAVGPEVGALARKGVWGAGHVGLNQALVAATIIFAGRVPGGVIAYQIAFTFFLLPHALLAHPIFTALFPRLSTHASAGAMSEFAADVGFGIRSMVLLLAPAAGLLAVVALPALTVVRLGDLDAEGARLVASVLAAYSLGLLGYSAFFMLTRASYALGDVRAPTIVNLWVTVGAVAGMAVTSSLVDGDGRVVVLGLVHGVAVSVGSVALFTRVRRAAGHPVPVVPAFLRAGAGAAVACAGAAVVVALLGTATRSRAATALLLACAVGVALYGIMLWLLRTPELRRLLDGRLRRRFDRAVVGS